MSGMEVLGLALGIPALIQHAIDTAQSLQKRCQDHRRNPHEVAELLSGYRTFKKDFESVQDHWRDRRPVVPRRNLPVFEHYLTQIGDVFRDASSGLGLLDTKCAKGSLRLFFRASSIAEQCGKRRRMLEVAVQGLRDLNAFLAVGEVVEKSCGGIADKIEATNRPADIFKASSLVPTNPPCAVLDFDFADSEGQRITLEGQVKDALVNEAQDQMLAIVGMSGVGKTTILRGLGEDLDVKQTFKDGIYFLSFGLDVTPELAIKEICRAVHVSGGEATARKLQQEGSLDAVIAGARLWFQGRTALLLLDDICDQNGLGAQLIRRLSDVVADGKNSALICTTRDRRLALEGKVFDVTPRDPLGAESRAILMKCAAFDEAEACWSPETQQAIVSLLLMCDGLPVALAIVGKAVALLATYFCGHRRSTAWTKYAASDADNVRVRREVIHTQVGGYRGLADITCQTTLRLCDRSPAKFPESEQPFSYSDMHQALCVLRKRAWAPVSMLQHLWKLRNEDHARVIVRHLAEVSMAELVWIWVKGKEVEGIRMHDLLHDHATESAITEGKVVNWHRVLLNGYAKSYNLSHVDGCREWWLRHVNDDGYLFANLIRHLLMAQYSEELARLLFRPEWIARQIEERGIVQLEEDMRLVQAHLRRQEEKNGAERNNSAIGAVELVSRTARLAAPFIRKAPCEVWFQLYGRLVGKRESVPEIDNLLNYIERHAPKPWLRPLTPVLSEPDGQLYGIICCGAAILCMTQCLNEKTAICGCADGRVVVCNVTEGIMEKEWKAHDGKVLSVSLVPDGSAVLSSGADAVVNVWDMHHAGRRRLCYAGHTLDVNSVAVAPDSRLVASASDDGTVHAWDVDCGATYLDPPFRKHAGAVHALTIMSDSKTVISGGADTKIRVWNIETGVVHHVLEGHSNRVTSLAVPRYGSTLVSGSGDDTIRTWDVASGSSLRTFRGHTDWVWGVAVSDDMTHVVSCSDDETIRVWESDTYESTIHHGHADRVSCVRLTPFGFISASWDGTVKVWSEAHHTRGDDAMRAPEKRSRCVALMKDGKRAVTGHNDGTLTVWCMSTRSSLHVLHGHTGIVAAVVARDERLAISGSWDRSIREWDVRSGSQTRVIGTHGNWVRALAVFAGGDRVASGSGDRCVRVWEVGGTEVRYTEMKGHESMVYGVHVTGDERRVVSATWVEIRVREVASGRCVCAVPSRAVSDEGRGVREGGGERRRGERGVGYRRTDRGAGWLKDMGV